MYILSKTIIFTYYVFRVVKGGGGGETEGEGEEKEGRLGSRRRRGLRRGGEGGRRRGGEGGRRRGGEGGRRRAEERQLPLPHLL